jgi:hypothetical protein
VYYLRHTVTPCHLGFKNHNSYSRRLQYLLCERAAYDTLETHLKKENESYINNCLVLDQTQLHLKPKTRSGRMPVQSTQHYKSRSLFGPALRFISHIFLTRPPQCHGTAWRWKSITGRLVSTNWNENTSTLKGIVCVHSLTGELDLQRSILWSHLRRLLFRRILSLTHSKGFSPWYYASVSFSRQYSRTAVAQVIRER